MPVETIQANRKKRDATITPKVTKKVVSPANKEKNQKTMTTAATIAQVLSVFIEVYCCLTISSSAASEASPLQRVVRRH